MSLKPLLKRGSILQPRSDLPRLVGIDPVLIFFTYFPVSKAVRRAIRTEICESAIEDIVRSGVALPKRLVNYLR
jgi:hypothetical protein